jgi:hypothetical protein
MNIMNYVQAGIVLGVVFIIQVVKGLIDKSRESSGKKKIDGDLWVLIVLLCGIPMALIVHGTENFVNTNLFSFIRDVFIYAAASSFTYKTYSVSKKKISEINKD